MVADLRRHYRVTTIDLPGMGCSGRPVFQVKNHTEAIEFFMDYLKLWMDVTKYNEEEYVLLGHSLGAYFSIKFAKMYP
jgi:pimeloyl-ACP methyl ester carboxylesterase